ncbi:sugar transferase, partial [Microbacterium sp.]|uniref:sugar transferase n=1 Tax=Microbacterium sp. TaxID=51671 RepID=UPI00273322E7
KADSIIYSPSSHLPAGWVRRLGWAMEDTDMDLMVNPSLVHIAGPRLSIAPVQGLPLLRVDMPKFSGPTRTIKRATDLAWASLLLTILGIPMLIIGLAIRIDSRGPAIFRQQRAGQGGKTFICWKFRTMVDGAVAQRDTLRAEFGEGGATFKMRDDKRVTRVGNLLRRFSIDELPQLVNVLKGDMSIVGPRPHPLDDVARYSDDAHRRLLIKPGLTGLWQVSGRSDVDWDDAVMLDLHYVETWTLSLDLVIMMRTAKVVLLGSGAY